MVIKGSLVKFWETGAGFRQREQLDGAVCDPCRTTPVRRGWVGVVWCELVREGLAKRVVGVTWRYWPMKKTEEWIKVWDCREWA